MNFKYVKFSFAYKSLLIYYLLLMKQFVYICDLNLK